MQYLGNFSPIIRLVGISIKTYASCAGVALQPARPRPSSNLSMAARHWLNKVKNYLTERKIMSYTLFIIADNDNSYFLIVNS
jgi:hypothetical protein